MTDVNETANAAPQPSKLKLTLRRNQDAPDLRERLQKVLAGSGLGARRGIEERITAGEVLLNGAKPELGATVQAGDRILIDSRTFVVRVHEGDFGRILVYSKPDGEVTTKFDAEGRPTVFDRLPPISTGRWIVMGDLDMNTQGLLLFTSNGELANKIMTNEESFAREYVCRIQGSVSDQVIAQLQAGITLEGKTVSFTEIVKMEHTGNTNEWWRVKIESGGTKDVKAMWDAVGLQLSRLKRISFGPFRLLPGMRRCDVREVPEAEVQQICRDFGIAQMPSYLTAEDEGALKLRRNRELDFGKKKTIATGKAEGFWTGERGYGGANVKAQRVSAEFDVDRNKRDKKARKGVKRLSQKQAQLAIGSSGLLSHALDGPATHDPRRGKKHKKHKRGKLPQGATQIVGVGDQAGVLAGNQALPGSANRKKRHRGGQRQRHKREAVETLALSPDAALDAAVFVERVVPAHEQGSDAGNRAQRPPAARKPKPRRKQPGGEATPGLYEPRMQHVDDNLGNSVHAPSRPAAAGRKPGKVKKQFSGPMDHSYEDSQSFNLASHHDDDSNYRNLGNHFVADDSHFNQQPNFTQPQGARGPRGNAQGNRGEVGNQAGRPPKPKRRHPGKPQQGAAKIAQGGTDANIDGEVLAAAPNAAAAPGERSGSRNRRRRHKRRGPRPDGGGQAGTASAPTIDHPIGD